MSFGSWRVLICCDDEMQFMSGLPRAAEAACAEALYQCLSIVFGRCFAFFFTVTWVCRGSHFWGAPPENVFGVSIRMLVIRRDGSYQPGVLSGPVVKCFSSYLELCRCLSFWVRVSKCLMSRFHDDITQTGGLKWCCAECLYLTTFGLWKTFKYDFPVMSANDDCKLILHT